MYASPDTLIDSKLNRMLFPDNCYQYQSGGDPEHITELTYEEYTASYRRFYHPSNSYIILDGEMETALRFAAERGVEVVLILPGIPDKPAPYALAKTHYAALLDSGVRICEYTPGFVHAKMFVCDGREAVVGTINLDYRSLYLHFECAVYFYKNQVVEDVEKDFLWMRMMTKPLQICGRNYFMVKVNLDV